MDMDFLFALLVRDTAEMREFGTACLTKISATYVKIKIEALGTSPSQPSPLTEDLN